MGTGMVTRESTHEYCTMSLMRGRKQYNSGSAVMILSNVLCH